MTQQFDSTALDLLFESNVNSIDGSFDLRGTTPLWPPEDSSSQAGYHLPLHQLEVGESLELSGASGSGKSQSLWDIGIVFLLPKDDISGGMQGQVILLDFNYQFESQAFHLLLRRKIATSGRPVEVQQKIMEQCLSQLHVIRCHSSVDVLAQLRLIQLQWLYTDGRKMLIFSYFNSDVPLYNETLMHSTADSR